MTKNIVKQPQSLVEVTITVPWAELETKWNDTLTHMGAEVEVPGFRKGSAPANMVEQNLGSKLQDEFLKNAMPEFLIEALKGSDVVPIDYPKYEVISFSKGTDLQFKATVTNRPTVTVGNYKSIRVSKPAEKAIDETEVMKMVDDLYKRWQARSGAPKAPAASATPTAGSLDFQSGSVATPASTVPDDEFAKAMGATSLEDLKQKIRKDLESNASYNNELDFEESILQEVEKLTQVELPDILIEDELQRMLVSLQRRVADMGLLLEDYLKNQNKTLDQLKGEWKPQAEKNVRMELGLADIARQENVTISDEELQAEIDKIQDPRVKTQFDSNEPRMHLRHALRQTRTLNLLKSLVGS